MPRRFIALTSLVAGAAIAVMVALAIPALAKGTTQASITGPGLAHPVTTSVAAGSEALPEQGDALSSLADQTGLFTVLFGPNIGDVRMPDMPSQLRTPPAADLRLPRRQRWFHSSAVHQPRQSRSARSRRTIQRGPGRSSAERQRTRRRKLRWPPTRAASSTAS